MKARKVILVSLMVIVAFGFIGCAGFTPKTVNWNNPLDIRNSISVEYDSFKKVTRYVGPSYPKSISYLKSALFLRAWRYDVNPKNVQYQIYIISIYDAGGWRSYNNAYDSDGSRLEVLRIDHDVSCYSNSCTYFETVGINISKDYLENHLNGGIRFKLSGNGGDEIHYIPGSYVKTFLDRTK